MILAILSVFGLYLLYANNVIYTGVISFEIATAIAVLVMTALSLVILFRICYPLSKYRLTVLVVASIFIVLACVIMAVMSFVITGDKTLLHIPFEKLGFDHYFIAAIIIVIFSAIYLTGEFVVINYKRKK
jgi:drug/metabolite transporter (DMT)-like permease